MSRHLAEFAQHRDLPFLVVCGGEQTSLTRDGSLEILELKRGAAAFRLDKNLYCDPLLMRHRQLVINQLVAFKPDLVHITGPGDLGFLGLWAAHSLKVPMVASWHTNLHEYLSLRLNRTFIPIPQELCDRMARVVERQSLRGLVRFYRTARFVLAPNQAMIDLLKVRTGKPAFLMEHGVDPDEFRPGLHASNGNRPFCIGYVGRLTTEKNVRVFVDLERELLAAGEQDYKFLLVGEGGQHRWLRKHLQKAELPGVLRGEDLAAAYRRMDVFVFPSRTDTFGLVILEAMASGVPVILAPETGRRIGIQDHVSGFLSDNFPMSIRCLMHDPGLREAMSSAARQFANGRCWQSVFERLYRTYAEGLTGCKRQVDSPISQA